MDKNPLQEFPRETAGSEGEKTSKPGILVRGMEALARMGLGETTIRVATNVLALILVVAVVFLMQTLYKQANASWTSNTAAAAEALPTPQVDLSLVPAEVVAISDGIARQAELHTTIPTRPRTEVVKYTVQQGDTIFGIADKYGLKPTTILFGNYETLKDSPDLLKPDQVLNILPTDGTYYQWQGGGAETLSGIASYFGVNAEDIVNYPGNNLDPETIGDYANPNIAAGAWLIIPGGTRQFTSWTAPAQLVQANPSTSVWGPGVCSGISYVQMGYGTFVYPTVEHWLSGTPYMPELGHYAVDFAGQLGNAIYATDAGTVVYAGWNTWGYGNLIVIDHGNGWESRYAHLEQINVGCGQNVGQGDLIGLMGSTGNSTGPHLHFELTNEIYGRVNPLDFLP